MSETRWPLTVEVLHIGLTHAVLGVAQRAPLAALQRHLGAARAPRLQLVLRRDVLMLPSAAETYRAGVR